MFISALRSHMAGCRDPERLLDGFILDKVRHVLGEDVSKGLIFGVELAIWLLPLLALLYRTLPVLYRQVPLRNLRTLTYISKVLVNSQVLIEAPPPLRSTRRAQRARRQWGHRTILGQGAIWVDLLEEVNLLCHLQELTRLLHLFAQLPRIFQHPLEVVPLLHYLSLRHLIWSRLTLGDLLEEL